jgi:hypothetical protein
MPKTRTDSERTMTMTRSSMWMAGVLVAICALTCAAVAQTRATDMGQAPGVPPSGFGDAVDRDVAKIRAATARFKTTEAAEAAGLEPQRQVRGRLIDASLDRRFQGRSGGLVSRRRMAS